MSSNDMPVIFYKVLSYLYGCAKAGKTPDFSDLQHNSKLLNIPQSYWQIAIKELLKKGYIDGLKVTPTKDGALYLDNGLHITYDGVCYLEENSTMAKVKDFLGESFQTVLSAMISSLIY
jgi:hypothetical protein